jgi:hypothetical protein
MKDELKILFVGNSFSDNMIHELYPIAKAFGLKKVKFCNLYIGGCTIETHYNNLISGAKSYVFREVSDNTNGEIISTYDVDLDYGFKNDTWDYISFQQASHMSGIEESYNLDYIKALGDKAMSMCKVNNPKLKFLWHMTWAYQKDATHPDFYRYDYSQEKMYNSIISCVKNRIINNKYYEYTVIPSGMMIQNLRNTYFGDTLTGDGYHLNEYGEAGIAILLIMCLTNKTRKDFNDNAINPVFKDHINTYFECALKSIGDIKKV